MKPLVTYASIFTGGGGWDMGLADAGLQPLWSIELDPEVAKVFDAYFRPRYPRHRTIAESVLDVRVASLAQPDVLCVSPPCQAHSKARKFRTDLAPRCDASVGTAVIPYVVQLRPRVVLLENVTGYHTDPSYHAVRDALLGLGYHHDQASLNFAHYGLPQVRQRLVARFSLAPLPPWPAKRPSPGWWSVMDDIASVFAPDALAKWQRERLARMVERHVPLRLPLLISSSNVSKNRWDEGRVVRVARSYDEPAPTVTALRRSMSQTRIVGLKGGVRVVPLRGLARLQTFPDGYALPEDYHIAIKLIGNAVPPLMARRLVEPFIAQAAR